MTDASAPRIRRGSPRANPPPRRALPRVTPLGAGGDLPDTDQHQLAAGPAPVEAARPATGRDLLIPNGSEQARRKGRGSASVPTLAELMPPPEQRGGKKHHTPSPARADLDRTDRADPSGKGKHGKNKAVAAEPVKEVALQVTLSKGLQI